MLEKLKAIAMGIGGIMAFWATVAVMIGLALLGLFFKLGFAVAIAWISVKLYPILVELMKIMVLLFIVLFLPLAIIRRVRPISGRVAIATAWVIGFVLVIECGLITYQNWGWIGAVVGLLFFGIGLLPLAVISSLFAGNWTPIGEIAVGISFIVIFAGTGNWILSKAQPK